MMEEKQLRPLQFIPFYLLWIISSAFSLIDAFVFRTAVNALAAIALGNVSYEFEAEHLWFARYAFRAIDPWLVAILSVVVLSVIISLDYFYRNAIVEKQIKRKFAWVTGIQSAILLVSALAIWLSSRFV